MLKFKRTQGQTAAFAENAVRKKCSFVTSQTGYSKAVVVVKNVNIPLAWPADEYFGYKKGC
jgi:hypothetical protein